MSHVAEPPVFRTRYPNLVDLALPRGLGRDLAAALGMAFLTALAAQIQIRLFFTPVPITGQTFAFLLSGLLLGSQRGAASQLLYLLGGSLGLPVFAGHSAGLAVLVGPSGGYLVGGLAASFVVGLLAERGYDRHIGRALLAMLVGEICIYVPGLLNLSRFVPLHALALEGFWPFLPGDALKALCAAFSLPMAWRLVGRGASSDGRSL